MKLALVSPYSDVTSIGIRIMSAMLKQANHEIRMIFIPHEPSEKTRGKRRRWQPPAGGYDDQLLADFAELVADRDLVGISLMTNYFDRGVVLTRAIKESRGTAVIWGGIHPTVRPAECLDHADLVAVGEAEETLLEVASRMDEGKAAIGIDGTWWKERGSKIAGKARPNPQDLDALPFPDYSLDDVYYFDEQAGGFLKGGFEVQRRMMASGHISRIKNKVAYQTLATRGCPLNCSYCANNALRTLNPSGKYLRRRSNESFVREIEVAIAAMPYIEVCGFSDDVFFHASEAQIEEFAKMYEERVGLPFFALTSPLSITRQKMESLTRAGLFGVQMGIESGDPDTLKLYQRGIKGSRVLDATRVIGEFVNRKDAPSIDPPVYDLIVDNPYETQEQLLRSFRFMLDVPRPYRLQIFSLVFFPGTALAERAARDGILKDSSMEGYRKEYHMKRASYMNILFGLARLGAPIPLLRFLAGDGVVKVLNRQALNRLYSLLYLGFRRLKSLVALPTGHAAWRRKTAKEQS